MGRKIPLGEVHPNHPLIYFLFLTACIAATVAIVSSLCGLLERIKGSPPDPSSAGDNNKDITETTDQNAGVVSTSPNESSSETEKNTIIPDGNHDESNDKPDESVLQQPLPPPPGMRAVDSSSHHLRTNSMAPGRVSRSNSSMKSVQRKLSASLSMKTFGSALTSGALSQRLDINKKLKHDEDSIWKKQIILGEKCRVPADEDDTVLYDKDGNRISTYHPKQLNVISMSRQSSDIDANAVPK